MPYSRSQLGGTHLQWDMPGRQTIGNGQQPTMQVPFTEFGVTYSVRDDAVIAGRRAPIAPNLPNPAQALHDALEQPHRFPSLRRALLPDDQIAVVVDERLPRAGELVTTLLTYVTEAGVAPDSITVISAAGSAQAWVNELPDALQDVRTEIHDPTDRKRLCYVASTQKGRRIYLNRTLIDAGQTIFLGGCRFDSMLGHADAASLLFPALGEAEAIKDSDHLFSAEAPGSDPWPLREEADEVAWLIGVPFLIHAIDGEGDGVSHLIAGTIEGSDECRNLLDARWRITFPQLAHTAVVTVSGDPARQDFETLARAALCAARVVEPNGRVVILSRANPSLGDGAKIGRA